jgi:hypothetical protein
VEIEIVPDPSPEERAALLAALAEEAEPPAYLSAWRRAGLELGEDETD